MAGSGKLIKSKIASVENVKKITKAMELVSVAKMKRAVANVVATREYALRAFELLMTLSRDRRLSHPLFNPGKGDRELIVVISSNKGLAGSYNVNVAKAVLAYTSKLDCEYEFMTIGKYSERIAKKTGKKIVVSFHEIHEDLKIMDITALAKVAVDEFKGGRYSRIIMIYTNYVSALSSKVIIRELLPVQPSNVEEMLKMIEENVRPGQQEHMSVDDLSHSLLEPNWRDLVDHVLTRLLEAQIYHALLEAQASEHSTRMYAMKNASENADELVANLVLAYNQARQAGITNEISEIVSGADALAS